MKDTLGTEKMQIDSRPTFDQFEDGQYSFVTLYKFYRMINLKESE